MEDNRRPLITTIRSPNNVVVAGTNACIEAISNGHTNRVINEMD